MILPSCFLLAIIPLVYAATVIPPIGTPTGTCNITGINAPTPANLADLRTPTLYTWTLSAIAGTGCAENPLTITDFPTWEVAGTTYPAATPATVTFSTDTFVYATFTFPGMTVTSLTPGEQITLFDSEGNANTYNVPITAKAYTPTSTSTTTHPTSTSSIVPTPTPAPATSTSSTVPIGGIVAGAVVGGVVVIAIIVFGWYKIRTHRPRENDPRPVSQYMAETPQQLVYPPAPKEPEHHVTSINADLSPVQSPTTGGEIDSANLQGRNY